MEEIIPYLIKKSLAPYLSKHKVRRMLDCGCGAGELTITIKNILDIEEVYGVDIDAKAMEMARTRGVKGFVVDLNYMKLPFDNDFLIWLL